MEALHQKSCEKGKISSPLYLVPPVENSQELHHFQALHKTSRELLKVEVHLPQAADTFSPEKGTQSQKQLDQTAKLASLREPRYYWQQVEACF